MQKPVSLQQINTNDVRESIVYADGDAVVCVPGPSAPAANVWLEKQRHAGDIAARVGAIGNPNYFVPVNMGVSFDENGTPRVRKQRAPGRALNSAYFATLSARDRDVIYRAIANFISDMSQIKPVLTQGQELDIQTKFGAVIERLRPHLEPDIIDGVIQSKKWFDIACKNDASVIFAHGDMNPNNIFYDATTRTVSFLDLADATYQNAAYVFEKDFAKLEWLDINRVRREFTQIPRQMTVITTTNPIIVKMRGLLKNFVWAADGFLQNQSRPQVAKIMQADLRTQAINIMNQCASAADALRQMSGRGRS